MFRTSQTRISLSDFEVNQTLYTIWAQRFVTFNLAYCAPLSEEEEDEAEFYNDSLSTIYTRSSSAGYTISETDRYACDLLKRYRDTKFYVSSSTSNSDDLPEYSTRPHAILNTRPVNYGESYHMEGAYRTAIEIPDSQISSTPPIESSTETSPPATVILSPRSPDPIPRVCRVSRILGSGYYGNVPILRVQVPSVYKRTSDIFFSDIMAENARFHGLIWQTGQSSQPLRDTYSRLPLRRAQQVNQGRYLLAQPPKEKSWTGTKAQSAKWSKQNTRPVIHRRPAKKTLVLEVIDQNDEEVEDDEERSSGK